MNENRVNKATWSQQRKNRTRKTKNEGFVLSFENFLRARDDVICNRRSRKTISHLRVQLLCHERRLLLLQLLWMVQVVRVSQPLT